MSEHDRHSAKKRELVLYRVLTQSDLLAIQYFTLFTSLTIDFYRGNSPFGNKMEFSLCKIDKRTEFFDELLKPRKKKVNKENYFWKMLQAMVNVS